MKNRLEVIPIILFFILITILELLNSTGNLNISNVFLVFGFVFIFILFITINIYFFNKNTLNIVIITISLFGYFFILVDMIFLNLLNNNEAFINLSKVLFLSLLIINRKNKGKTLVQLKKWYSNEFKLENIYVFRY